MADEPTILWPGLSGDEYKYWIYPIGRQFEDQGGNYIFAKTNAAGQWEPVYIGQTNELQRRFSEHGNEGACIERNKATHVHVHLKEPEQARKAEEKDLILLYQPPCNKQHVA